MVHVLDVSRAVGVAGKLLSDTLRDGFVRMGELQEILGAVRRRRGSIDFDLPESKILLGEDAKVLAIERRPLNRAHRIVEEFMLAANEAVASWFGDRELPTIYRVHGLPDEDKLQTFLDLARAQGFEVPEAGSGPLALAGLLDRLAGHPQQRALNQLLLRAMMQAVYSPENIGHYGLAAEHYLHFTSPIRRYPLGSGHPYQITERSEDHTGLLSQPDGAVDVFSRGDAHWTTRTADETNRVGQKVPEARAKNGHSVGSADFHKPYRPVTSPPERRQKLLSQLWVTVFIQVLHDSIPAMAKPPVTGNERLSQGNTAVVRRQLLMAVYLKTRLAQTGFEILAEVGILEHSPAQENAVQTLGTGNSSRGIGE